MSREEVLQNIQEIIRDVLDDEELVITDEVTAADVPGWDSLIHITLIAAVEDEFDVKFTMKEIVELKNVGQLVDLVMEKIE